MRNTNWPIAERTPISATRSARRPNSASSRRGSPNSLTSVAPGAEKRSVICVVIAALWPAASRSSWASREPIRRAGITKIGSSTRASSGDRPGQAQHHGQRQHQGDHVADDARQRPRERPLGADDVVVEAADERSGPGSHEERHRHPLHVGEHGTAQVEDHALADLGRLPAFSEPECGVGDGDDGDDDRQGDHGVRPARPW